VTYRGVIFDFNGVLLWDAELQVQSWHWIARALRGREMNEDELALYMHGRPNAYVLTYLAGRTLAARERCDWIHVKESDYRERCLKSRDTFRLSPGAPELLEFLVEQDVPRTIATSSEKANVDFFVQHLQLERWFDVEKIVYDDGVRPGKPAPDAYQVAARAIQVSTADCVVVEDAVSGIQAAESAGIGYIIGLGAPAAHSRLQACQGVSLVIESLTSFPREVLLESE
jgi:beta-phosphoglucomutase-like phosphatase (HAD superfamily)